MSGGLFHSRTAVRAPRTSYYKGAEIEETTLTPQPFKPWHFRIPALLLVLALAIGALLLPGCSDNDSRSKFSYLRSAAELRVDTVKADTLCDDPGPNFSADGFDPSATCKKTQKFLIHWDRPDDTIGLSTYLLYLDTTPGPSSESWAATRGNPRKAAVIIKDVNKPRSGLVFFFYDKNKLPAGIRPSDYPDTLLPGAKRIFAIDTNGRLEESQQRFIFGLVSYHEGGSTQGQPQITRVITGDRFPPSTFKPNLIPGSRSLIVDWERPSDPTSFFNPSLDSGIIAGYFLTVRLTGKQSPVRSGRFAPKVRFFAGGKEKTGDFLDSIIPGPDGPMARQFYLPDTARARRGVRTLADSLRAVVDSLHPMENIDITLYAVDSAGNDNRASVPNATGLYLTDTTQPVKPELTVIDSLTGKNAFALRWSASRDLADPGDGKPVPGPTPNFRIVEYRLARTLVRPAGEPTDAFDRRDTVIAVTDRNAGDTAFADTARFLPPGKSYRITLQAVDVSGYLSKTDTAFVTTDSVSFAGPDSGFTCPPGLVPIPSAMLFLGDASRTVTDADEKPTRRLRVESFCIEPYEHRDSTGRFMSRVTWDQADSICRALSPADSTLLCSEVEWERACEGFDEARPHPHGIQSERTPDILQASCNQATGDSVMAFSFAERNPICLTNEGVYDMAGNLSEWVRDPYNPKAYDGIKDSVIGHGFSFPAAGTGDSLRAHGYRGGNFVLPPSTTLAQNQSLARCSNRDLPLPLRPLFRPECVDTVPRIAVFYGQGLAEMRCYPLDPALQGIAYSDIVPDRTDSTKVLLFRAGSTQRDIITITIDSAFRGRKPTEVRFTTPSLAEVAFEKVGKPDSVIVDTLDASEIKDTTQATLSRVLGRESPSSAWTPRKEGGRIVIRRFYAYTMLRSKVAKPFYASRNFGFRCCSKPRPPTPP